MSRSIVRAAVVFALLWPAACAPDGSAPYAPGPGAEGAPAPLFDTPRGGVKLEFVDAPAPVPDLTMATIDGGSVSMADQRGKVVLVNFWATWCGPCREEIPYLVQLAARYPDHLTVIGVSEDAGGRDLVEVFTAQYGVNYPIVMSTPRSSRHSPASSRCRLRSSSTPRAASWRATSG